MKLYFGNTVTTITTLMILSLLGFIGWSICNCANIQYWGRRSAVLLDFGLVVCCFAAALCRCAADHHCRRCCAGRKNAAGTRDMVLCDVWRRGAENRDDGNREDHSLKRKESLHKP